MPQDRPSWWCRFWHEPVRAERLAITRMLFAGALLAEQLVQYLPNLDWLFGSRGFSPSRVTEEILTQKWRWSVLFFQTDDTTVITAAFWLWFAATAALFVGWRTRFAAVLTWFGAYCFQNRSWYTLNGGDDVLMLGLFLLMISPCGRAMSLDSLRARQQLQSPAPTFIAPWSIRLFQVQLCLIYLASGVSKLAGDSWWNGTTLHLVLQDPTMIRFSVAQLVIPFWITAVLTWTSLAFEVLFVPLVLYRPTRKWTLLFGVLFHLGIYALIEVGWFSFYMLAMYGVWIRFGEPAE